MSEMAEESVTVEIPEVTYRRSDKLGALTIALAKSMATTGPALHDSMNPHFKHGYASLAACHAACIHSLTENELALLFFPAVTSTVVRVTAHLHHSSDEWVESTMTIPHEGDAHSIGSALTYGKRYLYCMVGVVADADDDGNGAIGKPAAPEQKLRTPPPPPVKASAKPVVEQHPHAPPGHDVLQKTIDIASKRADQWAEKYQTIASNQALAGMSPEQKATFMGPTVFVVNDEPLSEDMAMRLKGEFVRCGWGRQKVEVKLVEICGEGKTRANLTAEDGEKLMVALKREATKS